MKAHRQADASALGSEGKTCAEVLVDFLALEGADRVFGVPGATVLPILDAIARDGRLSFVLAKHEGGAAYMADCYARVSGKPGVCLSTAGPGATNMITGLACAHRDGVPVLAITGQPALYTTGKGAVQESSCLGVDTVALFREVTAFSALVPDPALSVQLITTALRHCLGDARAACHLSFPMDVSSRPVPPFRMPAKAAEYRASSLAVDRSRIDAAVDLLVSAKRPVILVGSGAQPADPGDLVSIAERTSCPVASSPQGKGIFPESHPLSLGVFGFAGQDRAKAAILGDDADLLMVIGSRLDEWTTSAWDERFVPKEHLIQIDSSASTIGRNYPVSLGILGPIPQALKAMRLRLERSYPSAPATFRAPPATGSPGAIGARDNGARLQAPRGVGLSPSALMDELRDCLEPDAVILCDAGNSYSWALNRLRVDPPMRFLAGMGFAAMGHASAGAVGAAMAAGRRQVVAICGDGAMLMNGSEIHTAAHYGLNLAWIVLNDSGLGMVRHGIRALGGGAGPTEFPRADFAAMARALGAIGERIDSPGQLTRALRGRGDAGSPLVVDAIIDPDEEPPFMDRIRGIREYAKGGRRG